MSGYYWKSELHCAMFALRELERKLPKPASAWDSGSSDDTVPEWGTVIFCWESRDTADPGTKYSYQPIYTNKEKSNWQPVGIVPAFTKMCAACHTHPNNSFFSTTDTETARGESGTGDKALNMYMVNRTGAYRYFGQPEWLAESMTRNQRYLKLWGQWPSKD